MEMCINLSKKYDISIITDLPNIKEQFQKVRSLLSDKLASSQDFKQFGRVIELNQAINENKATLFIKQRKGYNIIGFSF